MKHSDLYVILATIWIATIPLEGHPDVVTIHVIGGLLGFIAAIAVALAKESKP